MNLLSVAAAGALAVVMATTANAQRRPTAGDDPTLACLKALDNEQRFQVLVARIGSVVSADKATMEMMASKDTPNDEERKALSIWAVARTTCLDLGKDFRSTYAPSSWVEVFDDSQTQLLQAMAGLYAGALTYGQFIVERQRIASAATSQMRNASERDNAARVQRSKENSQAMNAAVQLLLQGGTPSPSTGASCFKSREWVSGFYKNCAYNCLGGEVVQTISSTSLCPMSITR